MNRVKFFVLLLFASISYFAARQYFLLKTENEKLSQEVAKNNVLGNTLPQKSGFSDVLLEGKTWRVAWFEVEDSEKMTLSSNLKEKLPVVEIIKNKQCKKLINAGFYTTNALPSGLFIEDDGEGQGEVVRQFLKNTLFNGIYSVNLFEIPRITRELPQDPLRLAVQTGPILIENSFLQNLSILRDKQARRMVAATTGENKTIFLTVYEKDSVFSGPFLKDLPQILVKFEESQAFIFADAINLDGGSASAFHSKDVSLSEIAPVGSYFCVVE